MRGLRAHPRRRRGPRATTGALVVSSLLAFGLTEGAPAARAGASPGAAQGSSAEQPGAVMQPLLPGPRALRVALVDGVIRWVDGAKRLGVRLRWELLPVDALLLASVDRLGAGVETYQLSNRALMERPAGGGGADHAALQRALGGDLASLDVGGWNRAFLDAWTSRAAAGAAGAEDGDGWSLLAGNGIRAWEYYGVMRDHALLSHLVSSSGLRLRVTLQVPDRPEPVVVTQDDDIVWNVREYGFRRTLADGTPVDFHRYGIYAEAPPIELALPESDADEATLQTVAEWMGPGGMVSILPTQIAFRDERIQLTDASDERIEQLTANDAASRLGALLQFGAGVGLGELVTRGLVGATPYSSVFAGAMVGEDAVEPLLGAKLEANAGGRIRPGVYLGISPAGGDAFFFGLGAGFSVLDLAVGGTAFEDEAAAQGGDGEPAGGDTRVEWAGMVSIDLSRLFRQKSLVTSLQVADPVAGGGWGTASEQIARDLGLVRATLDLSRVPAAQRPGLAITLRRTHGVGAGGELEEVSGADRTLVRIGEVTRQVRFLPLGRYDILVPDGYQLGVLIDGTPTFPPNLDPATTVDNYEDIFERTWALRPVPGSH